MMLRSFDYLIDDHGDNVRPDGIQQARARFRAGEITAEKREQIENSEILQLLRTQDELMLSCRSDGNFRDGDYRSAVLQSVEGFVRVPGAKTPHGLGVWTVESALQQHKPIATAAARFLLESTDAPVRVKLPSAAHLASRCFSEATVGAYPNATALGEAIAVLLRAELQLLLDMGVALIELESPVFAAHLVGREAGALGFEDAVRIDGAAIAGLDRDDSQLIALTIGLGDHTDAPVDASRAERLFDTPYDVFAFPFHTDEAVAQGLPVLVPDDKRIGLGILDAFRPGLEDLDIIAPRLDTAARQHSPERITLMPHRGFHPIHYVPAPLTMAEQNAKLALLAEFATHLTGARA